MLLLARCRLQVPGTGRRLAGGVLRALFGGLCLVGGVWRAVCGGGQLKS